jgi:NAD(P)H-hydrate repair Nnr-like enzyme with NAD(P)H-hydrate epimerase domain
MFNSERAMSVVCVKCVSGKASLECSQCGQGQSQLRKLFTTSYPLCLVSLTGWEFCAVCVLTVDAVFGVGGSAPLCEACSNDIHQTTSAQHNIKTTIVSEPALQRVNWSPYTSGPAGPPVLY